MLTKDAQNQLLNPVAVDERFNPDQSQVAVGGDEPTRIGGFLILIAVGMCLSVLQNLVYCLGSLTPIFRIPLWQRLTVPDSPTYHPYWKHVLIYEAVTGSFILLMNVVALWLFFRRKRIFPKLVVILLPTIFIMSLGGYYLSGFIPAVAEGQGYAKQGHHMIVKFIALHIWVPYFLVSKRVGTTFVR